MPCSEIYKYLVAVLHFQKANFAYQVEEKEIAFSDLPKGHSKKGDDQLFLLGGHIEGMMRWYELLSYVNACSGQCVASSFGKWCSGPSCSSYLRYLFFLGIPCI